MIRVRTSFLFFIAGCIYELLYGIILRPGPPKLITSALFLLLVSIVIFFFGLVVDQISELRKYQFFDKESNK